MSNRSEKFIEAQFKLFDDTSQQILDNALQEHAEVCDNPEDKECETAFMITFMEVFERRVRRSQMEKLINNPINLN